MSLLGSPVLYHDHYRPDVLYLFIVVSLSVSFFAAVASLIFLVVIHKLEYFLNAHFVGSRTQAQT